MSDESERLFKEFPEPTRRALQAAWQALPLEVRDNLSSFVPVIPSQQNRWRTLSDLARAQAGMAFGRKSSVAIVGPTNVGKSTLYNGLIEADTQKAEVSPLPGTTKRAQSAETALFSITDTPGMDAVGDLGRKEAERALRAAEKADMLVIMFDAVQGIKGEEKQLFDQLAGLGKPYITVYNKMDLIDADQQKAVVASATSNLGIEAEQIIPISAKDGDNVERVLFAILKAEPALLAALGQALPQYRWQLAWRAIAASASSSAVIALTPIPFADFIPLVGIQASLVLALARIYNYKLTVARARELVGVLGAGYAGRTLFYELSKLGGPPSWLLAAAIAAATTVALGYAAILWFEKGETLTSEARRELLESVSSELIDSLRDFGRRKPLRKKLSERIREILERSVGQEIQPPGS